MRHNQKMSLLTEIDDATLNEDSSYIKTTSFNEIADIETHNVPEGNNDEITLVLEEGNSHILLS